MAHNRTGRAATTAIAGTLVLILSGAAAGPARSAGQQQPDQECLPHATALAEKLDEYYGEVLTAAGVDATGSLVQVYSNADSGTWTIAVTLPGGPTCIATSGEGWVREQAAAIAKPGRRS